MNAMVAARLPSLCLVEGPLIALQWNRAISGFFGTDQYPLGTQNCILET
jgi:hypothetical protein